MIYGKKSKIPKYFFIKTLKGQSAKFLSFNMLIGALDGALVQNLCPVPHFNPKL